VQCRSMYRGDGDPDLAPVGETEFANGIAACAASGVYGSVKVNAGIVGYADLLLGEKVDRVLEMHLARGGERFKGIRNCSVWDADLTIKSTPLDYPQGLLLDPVFKAGFSRLGHYGLSFDGWLYHTQIPDFAALARAFPNTVMVLDHLGAPLGIGVYAGKKEEVVAVWKANMSELARCENVYVKLGGLGLQINGFELDFLHLGEPAPSETLAAAWKPYIETAIELFGPERCMFECNSPVDKRSYSYHVQWNAFKRLTSGYSVSEKGALFKNTAAHAYRLNEFL
jgi:L-fuconolactonase